jgi:hypothetical protein
MQTITITNFRGEEPVTLPLNERIEREGACLDLIVQTQVHIGCPVAVELSLRTDGSVLLWNIQFASSASHYAHLSPTQYAYSTPHRPTDAQRRTVARWWAGIERPLGLTGGVGQSLIEWALDGQPLDSLKPYLDGRLPALA